MSNLFQWPDVKQMSIVFLEYHRRFRMEWGNKLQKAYDKAGGVISTVGPKIEDIYDDFVEQKPIKSESMEGVMYEYNDKGVLVATMNGVPLI